MKTLVYTFGVILSVFVAINISIVSLFILAMLPVFTGFVIAGLLLIFGIVMAILVFKIIRHTIVKTLIPDKY